MAPRISIDRKARAFLESEQLDMSPAYAKVQERLLIESGLIEETPETLLAMKAVIREYQDWIRKNREASKAIKNGVRG